ncbi:MAG: hypothetical protein ACLQEI_07220 [Terriglobales bacterium]
MSDPPYFEMPELDLNDLEVESVDESKKYRLRVSQKDRLRVIKTARSERAINEAADAGFFPLVKTLEPSPKIRSKFAIFQDKQTGRIQVSGDMRFQPVDFQDGHYECVVDFTFYYPNHFESPFAAYLIPKDIAVGEMVILEDLIDDYVGGRWSQGDTWRLKSCEAIWNGKEFEVQATDDGLADVLG